MARVGYYFNLTRLSTLAGRDATTKTYVHRASAHTIRGKRFLAMVLLITKPASPSGPASAHNIRTVPVDKYRLPG